MKRKDVYNSIVSCAEDELKNDCGLDDPNIMGAVRKANWEEYTSKIDLAFDSVYNNSKSFIIDLVFLVVTGVGCFVFIPLQLVFQISIFLLLNVVMQFIKNKGFYFMRKELKNRFDSDVKCKVHYRPVTGDYVPIVIGKQKNNLAVYSLKSKKIGELKDPRIYVADKEVLSDMIDRYKTKDSQCISTVSKVLKDDIIKSYCVAERLWKESKDEKFLHASPKPRSDLSNFRKDE